MDQAEEYSRLTHEALADVDAGCFIAHKEVLAWSNSLSTDNPLVAPKVPQKT